MGKNSIFDLIEEVDQSVTIGNKGETDPPEPKENIIPNERTAFLLFPFFVEMIDQFKDTLKNLKNFTRIFQEKFSDKDLGAFFNRMIADDIKKVELVQGSLLNYIRINNPLTKTDTVNILIEEELMKYQVDLEVKKTKLFKTLEKNLPEIAVPDDQLRYILSCVLQYVITLMPSNGYFGLYTRSDTLQKETGKDQTLSKKEEKHIEILILYTCPKKPLSAVEPTLGIPASQKEGILDLALRLVDEIIQRNRGMMKFEVDEKMGKTTISLRFPAERRKVVYYQPATELSSKVHKFKNTFEKLSSLEDLEKRD